MSIPTRTSFSPVELRTGWSIDSSEFWKSPRKIAERVPWWEEADADGQGGRTQGDVETEKGCLESDDRSHKEVGIVLALTCLCTVRVSRGRSPVVTLSSSCWAKTEYSAEHRQWRAVGTRDRATTMTSLLVGGHHIVRVFAERLRNVQTHLEHLRPPMVHYSPYVLPHGDDVLTTAH